MAATAVTLAFAYIKDKKVGKMQLITSLMIFIFGALTINFQSDAFLGGGFRDPRDAPRAGHA